MTASVLPTVPFGSTDLRAFSTGNRVTPLVDGAEYFPRLCRALGATGPGDQVYFLDFRGDVDERLAGPGPDVGDTMRAAAGRGI